MAMGRQKDGQGDLMVSWSEMPRSPGHVFYDRLQSVLVEGGFDAFAEASCRPYYAARMGAPSVPPGRYFRMHLVGYFEGIDSERGLEWRCSDSLSLRAFLRLGSRDRVPDHSWRRGLSYWPWRPARRLSAAAPGAGRSSRDACPAWRVASAARFAHHARASALCSHPRASISAPACPCRHSSVVGAPDRARPRAVGPSGTARHRRSSRPAPSR